jgi:GT2 family glycosyltransferase
MTGAPTVSVIVPHHDQPAALALCLSSLAAQTLPKDRFEVIVADNGSSDQDGLLRALAILPDARLVHESKRGAAHARNRATAEARGAVYAFIDADCVADPRWIETGVKALETSDLAGGEVRVTSHDEKKMSAVEAFESVFAFRQQLYVRRKKFSVTANLFATRAAAEAIGPFVHGVSEDVDWCRRAQKLGFRLAFNASSIISHPARGDWPALTKKWERMTQERWKGFGGRSAGSRLKWAGLAVATALSAVPHLLTVLTTKRLKRVEDRIAAGIVLARIRWWRARRMLALLRASGASA